MKVKSKAQIFVEQSEFLKNIGRFRDESADVGEKDIALVTLNGHCELKPRTITADKAVGLGKWLIETFTEKGELK